MRANPGIPWSTVGWTATTGIASGTVRCGDRICIRNRRNGAQTTAYVVDQGGKGSPTGFDVDYNRVFGILDADNQNYLRGSMDIDWWSADHPVMVWMGTFQPACQDWFSLNRRVSLFVNLLGLAAAVSVSAACTRLLRLSVVCNGHHTANMGCLTFLGSVFHSAGKELYSCVHICTVNFTQHMSGGG